MKYTLHERLLKIVQDNSRIYFSRIFVAKQSGIERSNSVVFCCGPKDINESVGALGFNVVSMMSQVHFLPDIICFKVNFRSISKYILNDKR